VAGARDHRILSVGPALAGAQRMYVRVGDHRHFQVRTSVLEPREGVGMQDADARVVGSGIELVIVDQPQSSTIAFLVLAKEEGSGLVAVLRPAM
jgi:hypothetical protein